MMLRVISLGAGVQSSTMALMAAQGEIGPMPDCAIAWPGLSAMVMRSPPSPHASDVPCTAMRIGGRWERTK
jgi:hypothetical protein